jgi:hypothetical protein
MTKKKDPKDKKTAGRPTVMTPDVVSKLEQAFSMGCSDLEACLFANISKQTLYDYQAKNPEFADRKAMLKETLILKARSVIATSLNNKDENTAKWYLERKAKNEFSTKVEQENTFKDIEVALVKWK